MIKLGESFYQPRNVYGIGRNYIKHAAELGHEVPKEPVVFLKPVSCLIGEGDKILYPSQSLSVHHEVEITVLIGQRGKNVSVSDALSFVAGYGVGLDMTARDLQKKAIESGNPWSVAKGFDGFGVLSSFAEAGSVVDPQDLHFELTVNGELRQQGHSKNMLFSIAEQISYLSHVFTLDRGDVIFTGTPEGVGPVQKGDALVAKLMKPAIQLTTSVV